MNSRHLPALLLFGLTLAVAQPDSLPAQPTFRTPKVFHYPQEVLLRGYPYDIDLIVEIAPDSIRSVTLFLRLDATRDFREIPLTFTRARYRYHYDPRQLPADSIEYYFVVDVLGSAIYAAPLDKSGRLAPVKRTFQDPATYFRERKLFK